MVKDTKANSLKLYEAWHKSVLNNKLLAGGLLLGVGMAYLYKTGNVIPFINKVKDIGKSLLKFIAKRTKKCHGNTKYPHITKRTAKRDIKR